MNQLTVEEQLKEALAGSGITIAIAESCTGGQITTRITDIPGSSEYMLGGVVSYANSIKQNVLNVRQGTLMAYGAVSEPTAKEMATGVKDLFQADYSLSVTGVAGPGGGTPEKPVGLTFIGMAKPDGSVEVQRHVWDGDRMENRTLSADVAMQWLLETIQKDHA